MSRFVADLPLKSMFIAMSLVAVTCVGCGGKSEPEAVANQSEIEQFLAENPDADVDMFLEDENEVNDGGDE